MKTKKLLRAIVNTYEVSTGCGTYQAQITVERGEIDDYFKGFVIKGTITRDKEYLYMWSDSDNSNPLSGIEPDAMIIDSYDEIIYLWKI